MHGQRSTGRILDAAVHIVIKSLCIEPSIHEIKHFAVQNVIIKPYYKKYSR
jgi:hypothetical protein